MRRSAQLELNNYLAEVRKSFQAIYHEIDYERERLDRAWQEINKMKVKLIGVEEAGDE